VLAIDNRGRQLDDWMSMTRALAEQSGAVQPAAMRHHADTNNAQQAIQLLAQRLQANAIDANELAVAAGNEAKMAADMDETGPEGQR
jgi:hypothetical protein